MYFYEEWPYITADWTYQFRISASLYNNSFPHTLSILPATFLEDKSPTEFRPFPLRSICPVHCPVCWLDYLWFVFNVSVLCIVYIHTSCWTNRWRRFPLGLWTLSSLWPSSICFAEYFWISWSPSVFCYFLANRFLSIYTMTSSKSFNDICWVAIWH